MKKKNVTIVKIYTDNKACIDEYGNEYTVDNILMQQSSKNFNVWVWAPNDLKHRQIKFKEGCSEKKAEDRLSVNTTLFEYAAQGKNKKIQIVAEDQSSAVNIIKGIVDLVAYKNKLNVELKMIQTKGVGRVYQTIKYDTDLANPLIVLFDSGVFCSEMKHILNITNIIRSSNKCGCNVVGIQPICIEQMCLQYTKLLQEIKVVQSQHAKIVGELQKYRQQGDIDAFRYYDINKCKYQVAGNNPITREQSQYIKKYTSIKTEEQYLQDELAKFTYGKPFQFVKEAQLCWYESCGDVAVCTYDKENGIQNKNQIRNFCNQQMTIDLSEYKNNKEKAINLSRLQKIQSVVNNQLFSVIYDVVAQLLLPAYSSYKTNNGIFKDMIIK